MTARRRKYRVVGRPIPSTSQRDAAGRGARGCFGLPADGPVVLVFGGSLGARTLNELAVDAWGAEGPAVLHVSRRARLRGAARPRLTRRTTASLPFLDDFGAALARRRPRRLARGRIGVGDRGGRQAGDPRAVSRRDRRPPDEERGALRARGRSGRRARRVTLGRVPDARASLLATPSRLAQMGEAMRAAAKPDAAERSRMSSSPSQPLAGRRIWIAGIGGAGMSAYALVAHAWGAEVARLGSRRDAVSRAPRRRST